MGEISNPTGQKALSIQQSTGQFYISFLFIQLICHYIHSHYQLCLLPIRTELYAQVILNKSGLTRGMKRAFSHSAFLFVSSDFPYFFFPFLSLFPFGPYTVLA